MHRVLFQLKTIGIVALIFEAVIITVLALRALERNLHSRRFGSHGSKTPYKKITPLSVRKHSLAQTSRGVNRFWKKFGKILIFPGKSAQSVRAYPLQRAAAFREQKIRQRACPFGQALCAHSACAEIIIPDQSENVTVCETTVAPAAVRDAVSSPIPIW